MSLKDEYELDLQLGAALEQNKRLHEQVIELTRTLAKLRRAMESIHAISYKSIHHRQPDRTGKAAKAKRKESVG